MNAKKKDDFEELAKEVGSELLRDLDPVKYFIDTGNLAMNYLCSGRFLKGGIPAGKITEISGPSSSGKSFWATNILRGAQEVDGIPFYLDIENSLDKDFAAKASHIDVNKILRCSPETMEATFNKIYNVIPKVRKRYGLDKPLVFVYDSLSASPCAREFKEINLPEGYTKADVKKIAGGNEQPGERAKICSKEFRKLDGLLKKTNTTLFVTNQIRQKIGIAYGDPTTTNGGLALQFHAGCRIRTQPSKKILNKRKVIIGVKLKAKNTKNRCSAPFKETEGISLYFETGLNPISGLLDLMIQCNRIEKTGKGIYTVNKKYSNDKDITFRANKEEQIIPLDTLLECPALVDGESRDEVEAYLAIFADAIAQSADPDNIEAAISEEGDVDGFSPDEDEENEE